jgi:hypothetical protein
VSGGKEEHEGDTGRVKKERDSTLVEGEVEKEWGSKSRIHKR